MATVFSGSAVAVVPLDRRNIRAPFCEAAVSFLWVPKTHPSSVFPTMFVDIPLPTRLVAR